MLEGVLGLARAGDGIGIPRDFFPHELLALRSEEVLFRGQLSDVNDSSAYNGSEADLSDHNVTAQNTTGTASRVSCWQCERPTEAKSRSG